MAVNFTNNDYSYLFSGLTSSGSDSSSSFFADYASIKNGSYGKLMKAYYKQDDGKSGGTSATKNKDNKVVKDLNKVQTSTEDLKKVADELAKADKIDYDSMKKFVDNYNSVIQSVNNVTDKSTVNRTTRLVNEVMANSKLLGKMGITLNEDSTLKLDKDTFEKASESTVNALFKGIGSFGDSISSQASKIKSSADRAITKADTYTSSGNYDAADATGKIYNSYT